MCEDMTLHLILQYLKSTIHSKKKNQYKRYFS